MADVSPGILFIPAKPRTGVLGNIQPSLRDSILKVGPHANGSAEIFDSLYGRLNRLRKKSLDREETIPQLKPNSFKAFTYGLKAVPFTSRTFRRTRFFRSLLGLALIQSKALRKDVVRREF
jgi:hypothetical protein